MSTKLQRMINRAVREALRGDPDASNADAVAELTASGEENHERQSGRSTGSGFAALAQKVREQSHENTLRNAENYVRQKCGQKRAAFERGNS